MEGRDRPAARGLRLASRGARIPVLLISHLGSSSRKSELRRMSNLPKGAPQLLQTTPLNLRGRGQAWVRRSRAAHSLGGGRSASGNSLFAPGRISFQWREPGIRRCLLALLIQ